MKFFAQINFKLLFHLSCLGRMFAFERILSLVPGVYNVAK